MAGRVQGAGGGGVEMLPRNEEGREMHGSAEGWERPCRMGRWVRWQGSRLQRLEGGVALEGLGKRHAILGAELVELEAAQTAKEKVKRASAVSMHAVGPQGMGRWVRWQGSRLELREARAALEGLSERHATLGAEVVVFKAAQTAKPG
jgi:hypothetical protein